MAFSQRELRAFLAVVDARSLGGATIDFPLSQPALSRLIHQLENRFGQPLFERHTKGMLPTAAGAALVPHARLLLFEMDQAVETLDSLRGLRRGTARIGAVAVANRGIVPRAWAEVIEKAPGLRAEVLEAPDDRLLEALFGRVIDVMITAEPPAHEDVTIIGKSAFTDSFALFCAATHPLAHLPMVTIDDAFAEQWASNPSGTTPRKLLEGVARLAGRAPPVISVEASSPDAIIAFVVASRMVGWLPRGLLQVSEERGLIKIIPLEELTVHRQLFACRRSRGLLPVAAHEFVKALRLATE